MTASVAELMESFMPIPPNAEDLKDFSSLVTIVNTLRGPNGCPWDKEQTHRSLTQFAIEEVYELVCAIEQGHSDEILEELGDCLLQVVLHSEIARQEKEFTLEDVILKINSKMISRHPHVFGDERVSSSQEVLRNWDRLKKQEKMDAEEPHASFDVPLALPSLQRAQKIGQIVSRHQFDWRKVEQVFEVVREEFLELGEALTQSGDQAKSHIEHELGDLLFTLSQLARHLNLDAEQSLRQANCRFEKRYFTMLELARENGPNTWESLSEKAREDLWQKAKKLVSELEKKIK